MKVFERLPYFMFVLYVPYETLISKIELIPRRDSHDDIDKIRNQATRNALFSCRNLVESRTSMHTRANSSSIKKRSSR